LDEGVIHDPLLLSRAVVIWTGFGVTPWPKRNEDRLVSTFGSGMTEKLLPLLRQLADDFYASDARFVATDLQRMGELAAEQFRKAHPELDDTAINALAWCYTYDFK